MSDRPDFRELVGDDLPEEERARLERVHEQLVAAGPPPELPPALAEPHLHGELEPSVSFLPRRRAGLAFGLAAAVGVAAFLGGFLAGRTGDTFPKTFEVPMHGTAAAQGASARVEVGKLDQSGNWPLKVVVNDLRPLAKGRYYEMFLTRHGKRIASCGTFRAAQTSSTVRLNAPYNLRSFDGWVVTREGPGLTGHAVVLTT
jgi:hypothetical protein